MRKVVRAIVFLCFGSAIVSGGGDDVVVVESCCGVARRKILGMLFMLPCGYPHIADFRLAMQTNPKLPLENLPRSLLSLLNHFIPFSPYTPPN